MAGTKRSWEGKPLRDDGTRSQTALTMADEPATPILSMFGTFRDELDEHHDRRERLIKISRDITGLSKKIIRTLPTPTLPASISKETTPRFSQINDLFASAVPDLTALKAHRYQRQISPGVQEFIEALSFHHYLTRQSLITLAEVRGAVPEGILVTEEDYLMGVFDLTGEMMRFAVMALSSGSQSQGQGEGEKGEEETAGPALTASQAGIVVDLRALRALVEGLSVPRRHFMFKDLGKKTDVMQNSVEKVERAAYGILVRGSERPKGWMPDLSAQVEMESY
ncbi:putative translin-associated factor TraX [Aspergillus steynii IBT 23096]|uniref:Putative translin-associated factor TraX n=1 Tax=Aspergillus steynii IBT 23096 TaxID=1392250 RepID=A0A2I2GFD6_9EURO|nr:putative translin-associated factor TraX [Aspergillus steynii IBT 23096]PLB51594.1 putative translin-associated factor TraX [Aspergillus steynii IBT 23096]